MKISIALATFNGEKYLKEQLDSFLAQNKVPYEVIVSDDGSIDATIEILEKFKNEASFDVKILEGPQEGLDKNFENALKYCSGDIICISDQDDVWYKQKLEKVELYFEENPNCDLLIHDLEFCDSELNLVGQTKIERLKFMDPTLTNYVTGMATGIRKEFLTICLPISTITSYDTWIHKCGQLLDVRSVDPTVLSFYRRHGGNATDGTLVNEPQKIGTRRLVVDKLSYSNKGSFKHKIELWKALKKMLCKNQNYIVEKYGKDIYLNKYEMVIRKINALEERQNIIKRTFFYRVWKAFWFWKKGGYSNFSGINSLFRDIIR